MIPGLYHIIYLFGIMYIIYYNLENGKTFVDLGIMVYHIMIPIKYVQRVARNQSNTHRLQIGGN